MKKHDKNPNPHSNYFSKREKFFDHNFSKPGKPLRPIRKPKASLPSIIKITAKKFMKPSYLTSISKLLEESYLVTAYPQGIHCFIITQEDSTFIVSTIGKQLLKVQTFLPNHIQDQPNTILEAILITGNLIIVIDILKWDSQDLTSYPANIRMQICKEKLEGLQKSCVNIIMNEFFLSDLNSIDYLYKSQSLYGKDGLMFYKSSGIYEFGLTENKLKWLDEYCAPIQEQFSILYCTDKGKLKTQDGVFVAKISKEEMNKLKFTTDNSIQIFVEEIENFSIINFSQISLSSQRAHSWSEILFLWRLRNGKIQYKDFFNILNIPDSIENPNMQILYHSDNDSDNYFPDFDETENDEFDGIIKNSGFNGISLLNRQDEISEFDF
ncbi:hypothetical protein SteCoe_24416 [Stentor coeruleus]|uniref:Snurportin-1 n=1 Tax=Stentor coeruleus TaxID=5963 RepID=A0A1R2BHK6_9CILI|nr:hypothetical protein SteCoe_24416 [Stentor coeruleus]